MDCKQMCVDFAEGNFDGYEFVEAVMTNDELAEWIDTLKRDYCGQSYIFDKKTLTTTWIPYSVRQNIMNDGRGSLTSVVNIYPAIVGMLRKHFPEMELHETPKYHELCKLSVEACPEYIDGPDVWESKIIDKIIAECSQEWSKTKKVKYVKSRIKEEFHLDGKKYPHWYQVPLWPFADGKPMKFEKTVVKRKGEWYQHYFVNVDTGETCIVDDLD